ncbi:MAG: hypothetical protein IPM56_18795 [Ignavibacteriales bacterium]|nr:MAG: hypothetical protein IPM56_18795 [Ignavibacteriales bacterium]
MNRKLKSTLGLVGLLIFILLLGGIYLFIIQGGELTEKRNQLEELKANDYNTEQLTMQYQDLVRRAAVLDSVLAARKFNIPMNLSSIKFFTFVNDVSTAYSPFTHIDIEFTERKQEKEFFYYQYKLSGAGSYSDVYRFIYAIEQSKELKKISQVSLANLVTTDLDDIPHFLVSFSFTVNVYFANNNRFATADLVENNLSTGGIYDSFFPLIRNEIPPNIDGLLDVQGAKLLALIPEGAFLADSKGNTYLVWEGEQVYLGYLTKIDYANNRVSFILNKGGIIEKVDLELQKEVVSKKTK